MTFHQSILELEDKNKLILLGVKYSKIYLNKIYFKKILFNIISIIIKNKK